MQSEYKVGISLPQPVMGNPCPAPPPHKRGLGGYGEGHLGPTPPRSVVIPTCISSRACIFSGGCATSETLIKFTFDFFFLGIKFLNL